MLKKDKGGERQNEIGDPGCPFVGSVLIRYVQEENLHDDNKEEQPGGYVPKTYIQSFRISKKTTFKSLKQAACKFWGEDDDKEFVFKGKPGQSKGPTGEGLVSLEGTDDQSVEKHFDQEQVRTAVLVLQKQGSNKNADENDDHMQDTKEVSNENIKEEKPEEVFLNQFPGVRSLYSKNIKIQENNDGVADESMGVGSRSCATFTVYCLMLLFTSILLFLRTNTVENYYSASLVDNLFEDSFKQQPNVDGVYAFLTELGESLLANEVEGEEPEVPNIRGLSILVGPIRLRTQRTKKTSNSTYDDIAKYHSTYKSGTKYTGTIGTQDAFGESDVCKGEFSWSVYKSESETKVSRSVYGEFSHYDGSGYVLDFDPMSTNNAWVDQINELQTCLFLQESSRSLFITFTLMNPSTGIWVTIEYLYEISVLGLVNPTKSTVKPFKPNIFETEREKGLRAAEFLRLFLLLYILVACIAVKIVKLQSLSKIFSVDMIIQLGSDLALVVFVSTIFGFVYTLCDDSTQSALDNGRKSITDSSKYIDFVKKGNLFSQIFILESFLFVLIMLKIIYVLSFFRTIRIISQSFGLAMKQLLAYCLVIMPILVCFAVIGMCIWGPFSSQYRNFEQSFISVLFFTLGQTDMFELMTVYEFWSILFMSIFFLILIYLIISTFVAIYTDSYRLTILSEGYPDQPPTGEKVDLTLEKVKRSLWGTLSWLLGWFCCTNLQKYIMTRARPDNHDNVDESDEEEKE